MAKSQGAYGKMVQTSITIPEKLYDFIDDERGYETRSSYIQRLLARHYEEQRGVGGNEHLCEKSLERITDTR